MKCVKILILMVMMSGIYTVGAAQETGAAQELNVLPKPCSVRITDTDGRFQIHRGAGVYAENADAMLAAEYLQNYCSEYLGLPLRIVKSKGEAAIHILTDDFGGKARDGQYSLAVTSDGVTITGAKRSPEACFLGVTTLVQMLPTRAGDIPQLPLVEITDYPRFGYRGMHLDVARHFFPVSFVKKYIDWIALHKLNIFHWHLTDDQGWRIELKSHPELTEKGSYRAGEIKGLFPGEYGERPYQAYYTQDEVKEVIDYAAKRFVTVVPEIDIPGHCMAVLAAHPEFSTTPREGKRTALTWGIYNRQNNVLAPTPEVFSFLDDVFNEVCALFPSKYIHAGGDECAPKWWNESAVAQEFMKKHNLPDAHALQTHFMHYVQRIINAHGKTMLGWSGGAEGMNPEGSVLHNWHSWDKMPKSRIDSTHQWINSGSTGLYFTSSEDSTQSEINPGRWPRSVKKVYDFELVPDSASVQAAQNLMGVEGCCWTEYCPTTWKVELQVFPRMAALAEKAWTGKNDDWEGFTRRLTHQLDLYDLWGIRYNDVVERTLIAPRQR